MFGSTKYFYRAARSLQCTRLPNTVYTRMVCSKGSGAQKTNDPCKKLKGSPCGKPELQVEKKTSKPTKKRESMWLNPFCDETDPTCRFNARFDDLYYVESDKAKRKYWQTWVSCPALQIKKKKICSFPVSQAPMKRRRGRKPQTARPQQPSCPANTQSACPRVKRRCHKPGRIPPSCPNERPPSDCVKPQAPYPAFSECQRLTPNAPPLSECLCWQKPMLCEVWAEFRKRNMNTKKQ